MCKTRTTDRASRQLLLMLHCKLLVHQNLFSSINFTTTDLHPGEGQVREEENTRTFKVSDHCRGGLIAEIATTGGRYRGTVPPNEPGVRHRLCLLKPWQQMVHVDRCTTSGPSRHISRSKVILDERRRV
jgi:hypothetical protein